MIEPWNLRSDDTRVSDSLPNFIIFCEDGEIEPAYFRCYATDKLKISTIPNCDKQHRQIDYVTDYCRDNDLLEFVGGRERLKLDEGTQVWSVYDRDKEPSDGKDTSFTDSINTATEKGIRVAWSNDDFELWILLHFEDVDPSDLDYLNRSKYYERLTEILKTIAVNTENERQITENPRFDYKTAMKRRNRFLQITMKYMRRKTEDAIRRSIFIEQFHSTPAKPQHDMSPCTMVHHLVIELTANGGTLSD